MKKEIKYTVIIPHKDTPSLLHRMLDSIPGSDDVEVIVVDDHSSDDTLERLRGLELKDNVRILHLTSGHRSAGAARNAGLAEARGKWVVFADADDYFLTDMKTKLDSHDGDEADIIYFRTRSYNTDTGRPGTRHLRFNRMIEDYAGNPCEETMRRLRYGFTTPWSKMIRRDYIIAKGISFDEVKASNDLMFSIMAAHHAKSIAVADEELYCVTENTFGLTKTFSKEVWYARFGVALRANRFLRDSGMGQYQFAIPKKGFKVSQYNIRDFFRVLEMLIRYRQNPFAGLKNKFQESVSKKRTG